MIFPDNKGGDRRTPDNALQQLRTIAEYFAGPDAFMTSGAFIFSGRAASGFHLLLPKIRLTRAFELFNDVLTLLKQLSAVKVTI